MPKESTEALVLRQGTIRIREDGYINVLDLQVMVPSKNEWEKSWAKFWAQAHEITASLARRHRIPVTEIVQAEYTPDAQHFIWVHMDLALEYASFIDPDLRADILITYRQVRTGEFSPGGEAVELSDAEKAQKWRRARQELQKHTPIRNLAIKNHNGHGSIYGYCADELNKATTGHSGEEIKAIAHVKETRDALDTSHLALQLLGESEQIRAMDSEKSWGNVAIRQAVDPVHRDIRGIAIHFKLHDDTRLRDRSPLLHGSVPQVHAALPPARSDIDSYPCRDYRSPDEPIGIECLSVPHPMDACI
jgi:hypothetical protein